MSLASLCSWYPQLVRFFSSNDVAVRGLRIENSPQFHLKFDACDRVRVDGLFVSSPASSPNTDGVHVENTTSVKILNSRIYNGTLNQELAAHMHR
jgi:polygalacturonase